MIKMLQCVRKDPALSASEFRERWREYGDKLGKLAEEMNAVRVVLSTTLAIDLNLRLSEDRGTLAAFDGVAEISWESGSELMKAAEQDTMRRRIEQLRRFQDSFLELSSSSIFLVAEDIVLDRTDLPGAGSTKT